MEEHFQGIFLYRALIFGFQHNMFKIKITVNVVPKRLRLFGINMLNDFVRIFFYLQFILY